MQKVQRYILTISFCIFQHHTASLSHHPSCQASSMVTQSQESLLTPNALSLQLIPSKQPSPCFLLWSWFLRFFSYCPFFLTYWLRCWMRDAGCSAHNTGSWRKEFQQLDPQSMLNLHSLHISSGKRLIKCDSCFPGKTKSGMPMLKITIRDG